MKLGDLIRERRLNLGLGQADIAKKVGIDPTVISRIENGKYDLPPPYVGLVARAISVEKIMVIKGLLESREIKFADDKEAEAKFERLLGLEPLYESTNVQTRSRVKRRAQSQSPLVPTGPDRVAIPVAATITAEGADLRVSESGVPTVPTDAETIEIGDTTNPLFVIRVEGDFMQPIFMDGSRVVVSGVAYFPNVPVLVSLKSGKSYLGVLGFDGNKVAISYPVGGKMTFNSSEIAFIGRAPTQIL